MDSKMDLNGYRTEPRMKEAKPIKQGPRNSPLAEGNRWPARATQRILHLPKGNGSEDITKYAPKEPW